MLSMQGLQNFSKSNLPPASKRRSNITSAVVSKNVSSLSDVVPQRIILQTQTQRANSTNPRMIQQTHKLATKTQDLATDTYFIN